MYIDYFVLEIVIKNLEFMFRNLNDVRVMIFFIVEISSENEINVRNVVFFICIDRVWFGLIYIMVLVIVF